MLLVCTAKVKVLH